MEYICQQLLPPELPVLITTPMFWWVKASGLLRVAVGLKYIKIPPCLRGLCLTYHRGAKLFKYLLLLLGILPYFHRIVISKHGVEFGLVGLTLDL